MDFQGYTKNYIMWLKFLNCRFEKGIFKLYSFLLTDLWDGLFHCRIIAHSLLTHVMTIGVFILGVRKGKNTVAHSLGHIH